MTSARQNWTFLEMIARSLEIDIDELGPIAMKSTEDIEITSMCSVFAESEVISLIANNKEKADIANGICRAIANKSYSLLKRAGMEPEFMMTGGVAKNPGVVRCGRRKNRGKTLYLSGTGDRRSSRSCTLCTGTDIGRKRGRDEESGENLENRFISDCSDFIFSCMAAAGRRETTI